MSTKIPKGTRLPAETKTSHKPELKDTVGNTGLKSDGIPKPPKENVTRKNIAPKVHKGATTRYGQQAELKEQAQNLMAANEELQKNLLEKQQRVQELELQHSELEKENAQVQKHLRDCHVLLVSAKIDPVLGERVGDVAQENEEQRKEVMSVSTDLLGELKAFNSIASEQRGQLQEIQETMTDLLKARELMTQERETFSLQVAEMEKALEEAESLLQ